jgi:hypothetical protein
MPTYEYKSIYVTRSPGADRYVPADDLLNGNGDEGWQLVCTSTVPGHLTTAIYEIFYFTRQKVGPTEGGNHD